MRALINPINDNIVAQVSENDFEVAPPFYWVDCPDTIVAYEYQYVQGEFTPYIPPPPTAEENKQNAISLLQQTDWTTIADVGNPQTANPYLANQVEFIQWRSQVRAIAINPTSGVLEILNEMPKEEWVSV